MPVGLASLLEVPDLGPKKIKLFWETLEVKSLKDLEKAAKNGDLANLPGMGIKSQTKILAGIESLSRRTGRMSIGIALPFAQEQVALFFHKQ